MKRAYFNWSGGKDSAFALWKVLRDKDYSVEHLLTSINLVHDRISMHGVRRSLLLEQANALNIPLTTIELPEQPSMEEYESVMLEKVNGFKQQGMDYSIFGDIFLEDLRKYREEKLAQADIKAVFPIWKYDTKQLIHDFIDAGFKTIVVCVNDKYLDKSFCGRIIDGQFLNDLPPNVDPCGENGEFHTFVFAGPVFNKPIPITKGEIVYREYNAPGSAGNYGFYFCDLF